YTQHESTVAVTPGDWFYTGQTGYDTSPAWTWQNFAMAYVKNEQIHACPDGFSEKLTISGVKWRVWGSYGANMHVIRSPGSSPSAMSLAGVDRPASTFMLMDAGFYSIDCWTAQNPRHPGWYVPGAQWNTD